MKEDMNVEVSLRGCWSEIHVRVVQGAFSKKGKKK